MPSISPTSQGGEQSVGTASALASSSQSIQSRNAILVSHSQKGNPLLKHLRNMRWAFADVVCGYLLGQNSCALYLSLRYHLLHPDYLYYCIRELQKNFMLRFVLCHLDVEDVVKPLLEVTKTTLLHDCTLLCAWRNKIMSKILFVELGLQHCCHCLILFTSEECGCYLETIKVYENKPADLIQGQLDTDYLSQLTHALTSVWSVNKTDVVTLQSTFGVKCLYDTFHEPFKRVVSHHPPIPETPSLKDVEPSSMNEVTKVKKDTEEPVKSALSAAFSIYADKMGEKKNSSSQVGETSALKSETEKK
ncbi:hypothetical protein CICLE_v10003828mg [Citrus x clementina]|uniref:ERCC1-like central domain-containing protein n=1 Tax=Citrus clementina TaxID=85681 RepID=V4T061_CITCL|nr:hypothetical protein CICLE_v10003828mg [Citrus x clementina]